MKLRLFCVLAVLSCGEEQAVQANRPPDIEVPGPQLVVEGTLVSFTVTTSDLDDDAVELTVSGLPEGAVFTAGTGQFHWVPNHQQSGSYNVGFSATDGRFTTERSVGIAVVDFNRQPALDGLSDISVVEGTLASLVVRGSDPDGDSVSLESDQLPRGATFDEATGLFVWRPGYDQAGTYTLVFRATDSGQPRISTRRTAVVTVINYTEALAVPNTFPIVGSLGDDSFSTTVTARTVVLLDFSDVTDFAPGIVEMRVSNITSMADASWTPFSPSVAWILPPGDGDKTVYARFRDAAENVSQRLEGTIDLDTTPPFPASAVLLGPVVTREPSVTLALTAQDRSFLHATQAVTASEDPSFATGNVGPQPFDVLLSFPLSTSQGAKDIYVRFRDVPGNDATAMVHVVRDSVPPSGGSLTVVSPTGSGFTNSVSVVLLLTAPSDARQVVLASAADASSCADLDIAGKVPQPVADSIPFLLSSGEGPKRVCGKLLDEAGNLSSFISGTITLDTIAPTAPLIVTTSTVISAADGASFTIATFGPVADAHFQRYQRLGGQAQSWTDDSTDVATTSFTYLLVGSPSDEDGIPNLLRLRARDMAGNVSPEASLIITTDTNAPEPVTLDRMWVSNGNRQAAVYWKPSPSPDVAGYRVYYGPASNTYTGTSALNGPSPIAIGPATVFVLSGLINGSATFASVRPVDRAGNEGPSPSTPSEVLLQPNEVALDLIAEVPLAMASVRRLALYGDYLYALGAGDGCTDATVVLQPVDVSALVSPVHGGSIHDWVPGPVSKAAQVFSDAIDCTPDLRAGPDLVIDGSYLYTASGTTVRVFRLADPANPVLAGEYALTSEARGLAVRGDKLFVATSPLTDPGWTDVVALDLAQFFDEDKSSRSLGLIGTVSKYWGDSWGGLTWTRSFLVQTSNDGGESGFNWYYDLRDALDGSPITEWRNEANDVPGTDFPMSAVSANPIASGNFLYMAAAGRFSVFDLNPLWNGVRGSRILGEIPRAQVGFGTSGPGDIQGGQAFLNDPGANGLRVLDLTNLDAIADTGFFRLPGAAAWANVVDGNDLLVGLLDGKLQVYEIAAPRALRTVTSVSNSGPRHEVVGGFVYGGGGKVHDLQGGWPPPTLLGGPGVYCNFDSTRFDDNLVLAQGGYLQLLNLDHAIDRDPQTPFDAVTDTFRVAMPSGTRATGAEALGNYLVTASQHASLDAGTGTYLDVFDARKIRDLRSGTLFNPPGDLLASYQVTGNTGRADLSMHLGRALVTLDGAGAGLYVVDLRLLFDDDPSTTLRPESLQGYVPTADPRESVGRGNYAYVATTAGLEIIDIRRAMDELPGTTVPTDTSRATVPFTGAQSLAVHGSFAVVVSIGGAGIHAVDVSSPLSPEIVGLLPFGPSTAATCAVPPELNVANRSGISVRGSRAYVTVPDLLQILELE